MRRKPDGRLPAPPHDASGHTWHHSDAQLFLITKKGLSAIAPGYESDMPAFGDKLSDAEITEVLEYIKSTWPERQRAYQAARSAN
jgi:mono/diheme cytochrome c family protein